MLFNNSYRNPETTQQISEEVGKPFTLAERVKLGGIGSPKLHITTTSIGIHNLLVINNNTNTCNIELRPKGIIIGFHVRLETYVLIIPYYKLSLYKGKAEEYSFYRDHHFIKVRVTPEDTRVHHFIKKILQQKADNAPTNIEDL